MLVFLGVYSALMCSAASLDLIYDDTFCLVLMFLSAVVFYGLFTVLETFRKGKLYGILGITLFFAVIAFRFIGAMKKGFVTIINSFLKEFMTYTGRANWALFKFFHLFNCGDYDHWYETFADRCDGPSYASEAGNYFDAYKPYMRRCFLCVYAAAAV